MAGRVAEFLGRALRLLFVALDRLVRALPGTAGSAAIVYGAALVHIALGWIVAGVFLLLLDRRS